VFTKAFGVWMARVAPVAKQAFPIRGNTPEQAAVFQLGVFLNMNAVHEHGMKVSQRFNQASQRAWTIRHGRGRAVRCVSTWARSEW